MPPSSIDIHVGKRVRQARNMAKMSQEELASHLGVTYQQLQKTERGINRIPAGRLQQVSEAVGQPVAWFYEGAPRSGNGKHSADPIATLASTKDGIEMAEAFNGVKDSETRHAIIAVTRAARK